MQVEKTRWYSGINLNPRMRFFQRQQNQTSSSSLRCSMLLSLRLSITTSRPTVRLWQQQLLRIPSLRLRADSETAPPPPPPCIFMSSSLPLSRAKTKRQLAVTNAAVICQSALADDGSSSKWRRLFYCLFSDKWPVLRLIWTTCQSPNNFFLRKVSLTVDC